MMDTIVYIGGFELPDKNAAAHRVLNIAKLLKSEKKNIVFIGVDKDLPYNNDIFNTQKEVQGFLSFAVPYPQGNKEWLNYLTNIKSYIKVIEKLNNVKAIILYNFQAIAMRRLMSYCSNHSIKCYGDITEWRSAKGENIGYRILKDSDTWYRMHMLNKKLDGLIVISKYLKDYYNDCENIVYIPTLTDLSECKWEGIYEKSLECLYLVYAGNPGFKDKLDILIDSIKGIHRKYHLDVIGITLEQYLQKAFHHKEFLQNNKNIVFHGRLTHVETLQYIKKANYSCFFREDDRVTRAGFPTKFAEAVSCNTPVLTNKSSNIDTYFENGKNGICLSTLDVDEITNTLNTLPYVIPVIRDMFDYRKYFADIKELII